MNQNYSDNRVVGQNSWAAGPPKLYQDMGKSVADRTTSGRTNRPRINRSSSGHAAIPRQSSRGYKYRTHSNIEVDNRKFRHSRDTAASKNEPARDHRSSQRASTPLDSFEKRRNFLFSTLSSDLRRQLQLDDVALYSVTDIKTADEISEEIYRLVGTAHAVITDGTACVGGNVISFCKYFSSVNAVELESERYTMLKHNVELLGVNNVNCYCADYLCIMDKLVQDVVFLDPPWGGPEYKDYENINLFLSDTPLTSICQKLKTVTNFIVLKVPHNFNSTEFCKNVTAKVVVKNHFRKMLLILLDYTDDRCKVKLNEAPVHNDILGDPASEVLLKDTIQETLRQESNRKVPVKDPQLVVSRNVPGKVIHDTSQVVLAPRSCFAYRRDKKQSKVHGVKRDCYSETTKISTASSINISAVEEQLDSITISNSPERL